jgi:hypothetical protein
MGLGDHLDENDYKFNIEGIIESNSVGDKFNRVKPSDIKSQLDSQFIEGKPMGLSSGIMTLDPIFRWRRRGGLYGISAYPQAGKSELTKYLSSLYALMYNKEIVLFSPEEETDDIIEDLVRVYLGKNTNKKFPNQCSKSEWDKALDWVEKYYTILEFDGMVDFANLTKEYGLLARKGADMFITDPWNYVAEGGMDSGGTKYLQVALSHMKTFSKRHACQNVIIEHQNKPTPTLSGSVAKASVHNITGGAMWFKKLDAILLLHSYWDEKTEDITVDIQSAKSKAQRYNGQRGTRALYFDIRTGRYLEKNPRDETNNQTLIDYDKKGKDEDLPF